MVSNPFKSKISQKLVEDANTLKTQHALDILKNEALAGRLDQIIEDSLYIANSRNPIEERVSKMDRLVIIAGWAWAAAGTDSWMDQQLTRWSIVMARWRDKLALIEPRDDTERPQEDRAVYILVDADGNEFEVEDDLTVDPYAGLSKEEMTHLVVGYGERDVITAGRVILHRTFKDAHVAGIYVAMYQGQVMPGMGTPQREMQQSTAPDYNMKPVDKVQ